MIPSCKTEDYINQNIKSKINPKIILLTQALADIVTSKIGRSETGIERGGGALCGPNTLQQREDQLNSPHTSQNILRIIPWFNYKIMPYKLIFHGETINMIK